MGIFSGIEKAKAKAGSSYINGDGSYWVRISSVKMKPDRKQIQMFVPEGQIIRVLSDPEKSGHRLGEEVCTVTKQTSDYFLSDAKSFAIAILDCPESAVTEEILDEMVSEDQPMRGLVVQVDAKEVEGRENPDKSYTRVVWKRLVSIKEVHDALTEKDRADFFGIDFDWEAEIAAETEG